MINMYLSEIQFNIYLEVSLWHRERERNEWQSIKMIKCYECSLCICAQGSRLIHLENKTQRHEKIRALPFPFEYSISQIVRAAHMQPIASKPVRPEVQIQ